jgi:sec-independent protein translocase protein TatC
MFKFFTAFDSPFVQSAWTMRETFSLITHLFLAFGAALELPVVVFFLALVGIVDVPTLWRHTPHAILAVFVVAAILTPTPDWVTQCLLAGPMVLLYLLGVGVAWAFAGGERRASATSGAVEPLKRGTPGGSQ